MFHFHLDNEHASLESLYAQLDSVGTEGMVSDAATYVWSKIKEYCLKVADLLKSVWQKIFDRKKRDAERIMKLKTQIAQIDPKLLVKLLHQKINKPSTEAFNPEGRGCFIVPKAEMLRVLADIDKATEYINSFGDKFIANIKQVNPSSKLLTVTEEGLPEIEAKLDELMDEQRVRTKIAEDFNTKCSTLRMNLNNTFVVTQDTIQVLWNTPPNKGDGTYAELGYNTEADIQQVCDAFVASVKKGYNNRDQKYIDEIYAIKDEVQKQERNSTDSEELRQRKAKLYSRIVDWLMMLKKMTIILDKEQLSLIENCYSSLSRLTVNTPTTWNWR